MVETRTPILKPAQLKFSKVSDGINSTNYPSARIFEIELEKVLPPLSAINEQTGQHYLHAWCLIRLHSQALGIVELTFEGDALLPSQYVQQIWDALQTQINEHLGIDNLSTISELNVAGIPSATAPACIMIRERFFAEAPFVSIIVPTHDRPDRLSSCLFSLLALHYPRYEIIIVDNAPSNTETFKVVQQAQLDASHLHYLLEDRPGVSWARNSGLIAAKGEILVFTDDDVVVDPYWLAEMARAFKASEDVFCVTGMVMPLELETPAQCLFERYGAFPHTFKQRIFNMGEHHPRTLLFPLDANTFGTGASMAFTTSGIRALGGFDPALGGTGPSRNGQDIDLFYRVVIQGHTLVYNPTAIVYHQHRRDYTDLQKQIYGYGVGFTAYLTKILMKTPFLLFTLATNIPHGLFQLLKARSNKSSDPLTKSMHYPKELTRLELKGMVYGPLAYLQTRWLMRKMPRSLT